MRKSNRTPQARTGQAGSSTAAARRRAAQVSVTDHDIDDTMLVRNGKLGVAPVSPGVNEAPAVNGTSLEVANGVYRIRAADGVRTHKRLAAPLDIDQTISVGYVKAEIDVIQDKVNEMNADMAANFKALTDRMNALILGLKE